MKGKNELTLIEIVWEGPYKRNEIKKFNSKKDIGLYQLYGTHNIFGPNSFLYLGKASGQTFSRRIEQHFNEWMNHTYSGIEIYVGRLGGINKINKSKWDDLIDKAEKLLIYFTNPPYNTQNQNSYGNINTTLVLNLGKKHCLPTEVSTFYNNSLYWTSNEWREFS